MANAISRPFASAATRALIGLSGVMIRFHVASVTAVGNSTLENCM